jgi:hypothetical protein
MIKLINFLLSFFGSLFEGDRGQSTFYQELLASLMKQLRALMGFAALGFSGIVLAMVGFLTAYFNVLVKYDRDQSIAPGAVAVGGLVLLGAGALLIYIATKHQKPAYYQAVAKPPTTSSLEQALSLLVLDYLSDRKLKREAAKTESAGHKENTPDSETQSW